MVKTIKYVNDLLNMESRSSKEWHPKPNWKLFFKNHVYASICISEFFAKAILRNPCKQCIVITTCKIRKEQEYGCEKFNEYADKYGLIFNPLKQILMPVLYHMKLLFIAIISFSIMALIIFLFIEIKGGRL